MFFVHANCVIRGPSIDFLSLAIFCIPLREKSNDLFRPKNQSDKILSSKLLWTGSTTPTKSNKIELNVCNIVKILDIKLEHLSQINIFSLLSNNLASWHVTIICKLIQKMISAKFFSGLDTLCLTYVSYTWLNWFTNLILPPTWKNRCITKNSVNSFPHLGDGMYQKVFFIKNDFFGVKSSQIRYLWKPEIHIFSIMSFLRFG